ncbi:hypothetical protein [Streptomyces sp. NPDC086147]|uniref:hypothetical protein n=1 Tax=Streptomyces sp. NPDC086147 TaxID=3155295 RepID=UPI00344BCD63
MTGDLSAGGRPRLERAGRRHGPRGPWALRGVDLALPPAALVRITVSGGRALPERPPGGPAVAPGPDGTTVPTMGEAHSDALLGALLAASWHVHRLHTGRTEPSEGGVRA